MPDLTLTSVIRGRGEVLSTVAEPMALVRCRNHYLRTLPQGRDKGVGRALSAYLSRSIAKLIPTVRGKCDLA